MEKKRKKSTTKRKERRKKGEEENNYALSEINKREDRMIFIYQVKGVEEYYGYIYAKKKG
jgi:hypothetical protein